ncbi:hypothetical protein [Rhizobium tumorigenes]|uniref:hypothetical protein n=1 Tax=Rhizobium tumorigenes TaxID=2041385 RepID=UPI0024201242|nr:hypothetical protein [Rhizobium tumorigenes]WFS02188.1 hypothetical protein PR016_06130 [Rhizobium tumorigenes]
MTPLTETTIEAGEIAAALGWKPETFLRKVSGLVKTEGMPERLPGRRRWSRLAIERWIGTYADRAARQRDSARAATNIATDNARLRGTYVKQGLRLAVDNTGART